MKYDNRLNQLILKTIVLPWNVPNVNLNTSEKMVKINRKYKIKTLFGEITQKNPLLLEIRRNVKTFNSFTNSLS